MWINTSIRFYSISLLAGNVQWYKMIKLMKILWLDNFFITQISGTEKNGKRMAAFSKYVLPTVIFLLLTVGIGRQSHRSSTPKLKKYRNLLLIDWLG